MRRYQRPGWTYHAKGLWLGAPPLLSVVGSSNFGERSVRRDLELSFTLVTKLTTPKLLLQRDEMTVHSLDFGTCPLNATRIMMLTLTNPSALPQRFGFIPMPKGLDVQPGDGLGTILPGESITREVRFSPTAATLHAMTLTCRTSLNQTYHLKCVGQGRASRRTSTFRTRCSRCRRRPRATRPRAT